MASGEWGCGPGVLFVMLSFSKHVKEGDERLENGLLKNATLKNQHGRYNRYQQSNDIGRCFILNQISDNNINHQKQNPESNKSDHADNTPAFPF